MIEAYKVGINLALMSDASRQVGALADRFEVLDRIIQRGKNSLNAMRASIGVLRNLTRGLAREWNDVAAAMERAARASRMSAAAGAPRAASPASPAARAAATVPVGPIVPTGSPGRALVPYVNPSMGSVPQGAPFTPYGYVPAGRPQVLSGPRNALVPYIPPTGFTFSGTPYSGTTGFTTTGSPYYGGLGPVGTTGMAMRGGGGRPGGGPAGLTGVPPGGGRGFTPIPLVPPGGRVPGGGGGLLANMGPLAFEAAGYLSARTSMREDLALRQTALSMGYRAGSPEFEAALHTLRQLGYASAGGTIYSEAASTAAMPAAAGVLGYGGDTPRARAAAMAKFAKIFPTALRLGEVAEMQHMGGLEDSIVAAISYAHMTNRYDPAQLEPGLDRLLNIARLTHNTLPEQAAVLKYSVPIGMASGMKPDDVAALTGFLQIVGFSGTTAGTGLGQLITGLRPSSIQRMDKGHGEAMRALGLIDNRGHLAGDVAPNGRLDAMALLQHIADYGAHNKPMDVLQTLRNAFTVRGMRVAGVMENEDAIPRLLTYIGQLGRLPGARATQEALAQSPMQQFEQMLARLNDIGNTLITGTLPGLKTGFEILQTNLAGLNELLKSNPSASTALGYGAEAAGAYLLFRSGRGLAGAAGRALGLAGPRAAAAAGGGVLGSLGIIGGAMYGGWKGLEWVQNKADDLVYGKERADWLRAEKEKGRDTFYGWMRRTIGFGPANAAEPGNAQNPDKSNPVPVTIVSGETDILADKIAKAVKAAFTGLEIRMDGREVGEVIMRRITQELSKPSTGPTGVDGRSSPFLPSLPVPQ